jgi:S-DNA-T family DNA segregation ATPase FtsK/SpoIIIE
MKKNKKDKKIFEKKLEKFSLPEEIKKKIGGVILFLLAIIIGLSFFEAAGKAGQFIFSFFHFLIGKTVFLLPLILVLSGLVIFLARYKKFLFAEILAIFLLILGISGIFAILTNWSKDWGGWLGNLVAKPLFQLFGFWVSQIIFIFLILISGIIFWHLFLPPSSFLEKGFEKKEKKPLLSRVFKKVFEEPSFKIKEIESPTFEELKKEKEKNEKSSLELKTEPIDFITKSREKYQPPDLELLDSEKEKPKAGDIRINSAIIKKTLENFEIPVEMSEVNVGPTVTQYTLKPAQGIKLSKITALSNDLALALASHPIRIEAPIPGKSLVGIEVPNKIRAQVRLRDLLSHPQFQNSLSNLIFALGRDVSGLPLYADLARMPHLLISGSTGTGKTIMINSLILSLIYRNSPEILRFILIDPKRVEFSIYNQLPHLLLPVIFDAQKTVNTLKWLVMEMERRFDILSDWGTRDIISYNQEVLKQEQEPLPYIVFIIDELADLMASRPREIEAGIVRLAQMARAVGIHLVVATQRPSVEVITGLIKANITSRIAFQVASQVDSRTILDMAGAEKLLGSGDMLFVSTEVTKPKRIQGAYVSEREIKRVVNWLKSKITFPLATQPFLLNEEILEEREALSKEMGFEEDPLYPEAEKVVREAKKASASLLQRKLRIGYARAARLIDIMEEKGIVGPGEGAKPREVYIDKIQNSNFKNQTKNNEWQKI